MASQTHRIVLLLGCKTQQVRWMIAKNDLLGLVLEDSAPVVISLDKAALAWVALEAVDVDDFRTIFNTILGSHARKAGLKVTWRKDIKLLIIGSEFSESSRQVVLDLLNPKTMPGAKLMVEISEAPYVVPLESGTNPAPVPGALESTAYAIKLEEVTLSVRPYNCLKRVGIDTLGDLVLKSEQDLSAIPNFGKASIKEVKEILLARGLRLRGDSPDPAMENFPIEELELGVRPYNCLKRVGIDTLADLTSKKPSEVMAIPNLGRKGTDEILEELGSKGQSLASEAD